MEYELYHYGVKGMKWGVRKDRESTTTAKKNPKPERENGAIKTAWRIGKASMSNVPASIKLNGDYGRAALSDIPAAMKYAKTSVGLIKKDNRTRFIRTLNAHMDAINDDISKITIGSDFFTKHQNDTVDDIIKDGNNAMVAYMLLNYAGQSNNAQQQHQRMVNGMM